MILQSIQCLRHSSNQVFGILNTARYANETIGDSNLQAILLQHICMSHNTVKGYTLILKQSQINSHIGKIYYEYNKQYIYQLYTYAGQVMILSTAPKFSHKDHGRWMVSINLRPASVPPLTSNESIVPCKPFKCCLSACPNRKTNYKMNSLIHMGSVVV